MGRRGNKEPRFLALPRFFTRDRQQNCLTLLTPALEALTSVFTDSQVTLCPADPGIFGLAQTGVAPRGFVNHLHLNSLGTLFSKGDKHM